MTTDRRGFLRGVALAAGAGLLARPGLALAASDAEPSKPAPSKPASSKPASSKPASPHLGTSQPVSCTIVADAASGKVLVRQGPCDHRFSPCSTFKLPLAVMGFDSGILEDAHHPLWKYQPHFNAGIQRHRQDTDPTIWLKESVVWYSQELTRKLGAERFKSYVTAFGYGNEDVSGNPGKKDGLTHAWLTSSLQISPDEQVAFIERFLDRKLGVSSRAYAMTEASMPQFAAEGGWTVMGKTGSGWRQHASGAPDKDQPLGWFVGWAEKASRRIVFARLESKHGMKVMQAGSSTRDSLLKDLATLAGN